MSTYEFKLPDIGEGVVEGEIVKWLVKAGESVSEDQPLVEVMTDKATVTIPSPKQGRILQTHGQEGDIAKVHQPLVTLEIDGAGSATSPPQTAKPAERTEGTAASARPPTSNGGARDVKVLATPVTRRMAREHGLQIERIVGTGPQGRVTKADVEAAIGRGPPRAGAKEALSPSNIASSRIAPAAPLAPARGDERIPLRGLRRRVAEKMVRSKRSAPHYTFVEEMDASALVAMRQRLNEALGVSSGSAKLSYLPLILKALVAALKRFPTLNANFDEEREELVVRGAYNFGIAAATDEGLTVPVVKNVDQLSVQELADEIARLATAARERKLKLDELSGGTFTVTSLGQKAGLLATPIINHPEVAILGVHRIRKRPVVVNDQIAIREMMYLSLSFDHRVIDGALGAEFTYALIGLLENPELLLLELR
jgi:pyruvate dehydrogenase E2 component (dihydrolipoamide acetyltransferase)